MTQKIKDKRPQFTSYQLPVLLFNASGTLFQYQTPIESFYHFVLTQWGLKKSPGEVGEILFRATRGLNESFEKNLHREWTSLSWFRWFAEIAGIDEAGRESFVKLAVESWSQMMRIGVGQDVIDVCAELKKRRYRLGVVSNWAGPLADVLRDHFLLDYFDVVMTSHDAGISKPQPEIFKMALEDLDVAPSEAAMIGGSYAFDLLGAASLGLKRILYDPRATELKSLTFERPEGKVISIGEARQHRGLDGVIVVKEFKELLEVFQ